MKQLFSTFIILCLPFVGGFSFVSAQQVSAKIALSPENPEPRSPLTLTLTSYTFNMDTALVSWKVDGVVRLSGIGEKMLTLQTGGVGESQEVVVTAENQAGYFVEQKITITPATVTLIHEAPNSYVPFFYEGRSFAASAGLVRVTALPSLSDGNGQLNPSDLSYTWYVNDEVSKALSGRGKQSADVRLDYLRSKTDVRVIVRTPSGTSVSKTTSITPFTIKPTIYRYDEILGTLLNYPIVKRLEVSKATPVRLEPYFVSSGDAKPPIYKWLLDGFNITPFDGQTATLAPKENSYGVSQLNLSITGPDKRLQSAATNLEIVFDSRQ